MIRLALSLLALVTLVACGAESVYAPDDVVARAAYVDPGPKTITLYTVINNRSQEGAHSALMINGSQRVLFDPAGSWFNRHAPERNDVIFGMTPTLESFFDDYHARETFRVRKQTVVVTPEQAEIAIQRALQEGPVPQARCAWSTSDVLSGVPGFESIPRTLSPKKLSKSFAKLPGIVEDVEIRDEDPDERGALLNAQNTGATQ
ncbi:hypothetical protein [Neotabrizicola shimadae]|uniref:Lipoprotein n=1 Tax=Neotabrizicola shimadae TaxID=2807096 RepID=A0A8G1EAV1_9RHOB|nr:hypothetical protein [Neotabrizicola shimadae]QYZ68980.1 hypothetical protein JO391_14675 [Neotabrizicola shimadae]